MVVVPEAERLAAGFDISEVSVPADDVVLVLLVKGHLGVHVVLNDLLAPTVIQVALPSGVDFLAVEVMVAQRVRGDQELGTAVHVETTECNVNQCNDDCVNT